MLAFLRSGNPGEGARLAELEKTTLSPSPASGWVTMSWCRRSVAAEEIRVSPPRAGLGLWQAGPQTSAVLIRSSREAPQHDTSKAGATSSCGRRAVFLH